MKTRYRFIHFEQTSGGIWLCYANKGNYELGFCEPYPKWHQWQFAPERGAFFTSDCLTDIAHFLGQLEKP